jgi:hypothetical protein
MKRKVLVILSNRFAPLQKPRCFEIECKQDGTVLREKALKAMPKKAVYDEVWENNDAKTAIDSCNRMSRHYKHKLLKPS